MFAVVEEQPSRWTRSCPVVTSKVAQVGMVSGTYLPCSKLIDAVRRRSAYVPTTTSLEGRPRTQPNL